MRFFTSLLLLALLVSPVRALAQDRAGAFVPDIYPSKFAAMRAVGEQAADALATRGGLAGTDAIILSGNCCDEARDSFASALKRRLPGVRIVSDPDERATRIEVTVSDVATFRNPLDEKAKLERGAITVTLRSADAAAAVATRYIEKPWADDWSAFTAADAGGRWIRGQSVEYASSEAHALTDARRSAVAELWPRVHARMVASFRSQASLIRVDEPRVRARLESLLREEKYVADQFVQAFDRPYGRVWQASVLVDASGRNLDDMARRCAHFARAEITAKAVTAGSMFGLFAVLFLTYLFVNTVTKGYFVWRLRAMVLLLGIAGILIVLAIR